LHHHEKVSAKKEKKEVKLVRFSAWEKRGRDAVRERRK
jgi:hypothetical protein